MNLAASLPAPLNTFVVDVPANEYYDFELAPGSKYPLPGVTYSVDYGHIQGFSSEDSHELDLFVGQTSIKGLQGSIKVFRGADRPDEHKFYVALSEVELNQILKELDPVMLGHNSFNDLATLLAKIEMYKDKV